ncbi:beta-N-acetylhexosaminidase [Thaumasiovibrio subtropicus]|uniref:beta-N-acetylhexosaminidase n=1 Tax=Thaumasiovibrio subtropicus TaxID=1891207 RepID=UPI00131D368F|nr:beta-N-acetylhexosaminidase [Thaumasiovibrio subtropicus]
MSSPKYGLSVTVLENKKGDLRVGCTLANTSGIALNDFQLVFNLSRELVPEKLVNCELVSQVGSYCVLSPLTDTNLAVGESWYFELCSPTEKIDSLMEMPIGINVLSQGEYFPVALSAHNLNEPQSLDLGSVSLPNAQVGVVPQPASMTLTEGVFQVPMNLFASIDEAVADCQIETSLAWFNQQLPIAISVDRTNTLPLAKVFFEKQPLADEGYGIQIQPAKITLSAQSQAGFFYALVTLAQLLQQTPYALPCQCIEDEPRFGYRGHMLDCARHFHTVDTVKEQIDQMAWLKMNRFHWHLTDDEGWRVEIDAYPELTQVGAWRGVDEVLAPQFGSGPNRYGGYYSKAEIREVVAYAAARNIMVIPEIDVPGHARALVQALSAHLVEPDDHSQYISIQQYRDNVVNPALPETYTVLRTILDEVCELFPSPYIHLGCDEVPEGVWTDSPAALAQCEALGLESVRDLQGILLAELQAYLANKGRKVVGWEELIQGDKVTKEAVICSWRGVEAGIDAANRGYGVVMSPAQFTYFDLAWHRGIAEPGVLWAGHLNLETVYGYEPLEGELISGALSNILGVQSQMWTEYVTTPQQLHYLTYPRLFALAEVAWSHAESKDWLHFLSRLPYQLQRLESARIAYRSLDNAYTLETSSC